MAATNKAKAKRMIPVTTLVLGFFNARPVGGKYDTLHISRVINVTRTEASVAVCRLVKEEYLLADRTDLRNQKYYLDNMKVLYDWFLYENGDVLSDRRNTKDYQGMSTMCQ